MFVRPLCFILLITCLNSACAQDGTKPTRKQQSSEAEQVLDEIIVTAQKREENLQNVPMVVTVLSETLLKDSGVQDIKTLQSLVSGLIVNSTQNESQTTARIRGVGTVGDNVGLESSVGVVIDGVYRPRNGVAFGDLGELERIEVLKGPQGTLFGKNTTAGVINIITKRPSFDTKAKAELSFGNYAERGVAASYNAGINEISAFRLFAAKRQHDGFMDIDFGAGPRTEKQDYDKNFHTFRGQFLLFPLDAVEVNFSFDQSQRDELCCASVTTIRGPTAAIVDSLVAGGAVAPIGSNPFDRRGWSNRSTAHQVADRGLTTHVYWDNDWFGGARLTSISAKRDWQSTHGLDIDYTAADLLYRNPEKSDNYIRFNTFSQELQLTGSQPSLDWMLGLFYARESLERNESWRVGAAYEPYLSIALLSRINPALGASATAPIFLAQATGQPAGTVFLGHAAADRYQQNSNSVALFSNNTWHASDQLDLTFGLRFTQEKKDLASRYRNPNGSAGCRSALSNPAQVAGALTALGLTAAQASAATPQVVGFVCLPWTNIRHDGRATAQQIDENEWSGTLKTAYRLNEHWMGYFSAARGYKAGGFNLDRVQSSNGLSSGAAGIVPVDNTAFPAEFVYSYELGAKTTWLEGNLLFNATAFHQRYRNFQLNNFLGTSFVVRSVPRLRSKGVETELLWKYGGWMTQAGLTWTDTRYGNDLLPDPELALLPGNRISFAPKWSGSASLGYQWRLANALAAKINLGAKYMSDYYAGTDLDPQKLQDAYTMVHLRMGIARDDGRWSIEAWANNLTAAEYAQSIFDTPLQAGSWNAILGEPRTYGITFRFAL